MQTLSYPFLCFSLKAKGCSFTKSQPLEQHSLKQDVVHTEHFRTYAADLPTMHMFLVTSTGVTLGILS